MEAQSLSNDIGSVSPEWLQSDDSFSFNTFGDIDVLMVDLTLQPCPHTHVHTPIDHVWCRAPKTARVCND